MLNKKIILISLVIFILINMSVVCAEENITDTNESQVCNNSFEDIQLLINDACENDTIVLNGTYSGNGKEVTVNKCLTIEGINNATLDARGLSRIFNIRADNVLIKNFNFINGVSNGKGGAIHWTGNNGTITNSIFNNNTAHDDECGAVFWRGSDGTIINTTFKDTYHTVLIFGAKKFKIIGISVRGVFSGSLFELMKDYCYLKLATVNSIPQVYVSNINSNYGDKLNIRFKISSRSIPWANETIIVKGLKQDFQVKTDENGEALLTLPKNTSAGNYVLQLECHDKFIGSTWYKDYSKYEIYNKFSINISKVSVKLSLIKNKFYYGGNNYLQAKVINTKSGMALSGVKVLFKFKGRSYYAFSNDKGVVKFKIPKLNEGVYDFKIKAVKNGISKNYNHELTIKKIPVIVKKKIKNRKLTVQLLNKNTKKPLKSFNFNLKRGYNIWLLKTDKNGKVTFKLKKGLNKVSLYTWNENYKLNYKFKVKT